MPFLLAPLHSQNTLTQGAKFRRSVLQGPLGKYRGAHGFAIVDRPVGEATVFYINYDAKAAATVLAQVAACRRLFGGEFGCKPSPTGLQAAGSGLTARPLSATASQRAVMWKPARRRWRLERWSTGWGTERRCVEDVAYHTIAAQQTPITPRSSGGRCPARSATPASCADAITPPAPRHACAQDESHPPSSVANPLAYCGKSSSHCRSHRWTASPLAAQPHAHARVPATTRYSCSKRACSGVPRFHSSQKEFSASTNSASWPFLCAFAWAVIVGPYFALKCSP